jgi:uridine kinase
MSDTTSHDVLLFYLIGSVCAAEWLRRRFERKSTRPAIDIPISTEELELMYTPPSSARKKTSFLPFLLKAKEVEEKTEDRGQMIFMSHATSSAQLIAPIVQRIDCTSVNDIIVIGIAGGSGSGKTTLARAIYDSIGIENVSYISHDSYYRDLSHLAMEERERQNFDHPDALETSLLVQHISDLKSKKPVNIPTYDFHIHSRKTETVLLEPRPVILVEGILIFSESALHRLIDIKLFVDTDDDIRFIRRLQRDTTERGRSIQSVIHQYSTTVRPMHLQFVEPSKRNADIIVPVGLNSVALDLVVAKLQSHLALNL